MISGKVVRVPGASKDVTLNDGATVADALTAAELTPSSNEEVRLNAIVSTTDATLTDGFRIMLVQGAKGN